MAETSIARPYALAAFQQAQHEEKTAEWADMFEMLELVVRDPTMAGLIANPRVDATRLSRLIVDVAGERLSDTGRNFVRLLAENRRLLQMPDIVRIYRAERARAEFLSEIRVTSAYELTPAQQNMISVAMTKRLGTKVELSTEIDPSLIGGIVSRAGDLVVDASLRGRLRELGNALA